MWEDVVCDRFGAGLAKGGSVLVHDKWDGTSLDFGVDFCVSVGYGAIAEG